MNIEKYKKRVAELKNEYYQGIEKFTPQEIKDNPLINLNQAGETEFVITKDLINELQLQEWLNNYRKEAEVSTGGIRGVQNILYYWDYRFPLNQLGVALATHAKALVLKEDHPDEELNKVVAGEVRYNTKEYVELISRIQSAMGIKTHLPFNRETTAVWMVSFLVFMFDYNGGEFVTSSHAMSSKIATKDLDDEGSQFMSEMSVRFVDKIQEIINHAKNNIAGYKIKLAPRNNKFIEEDFDGIDMYVEYLRKGVATDKGINLVKEQMDKGFNLMMETVGGCMYRVMEPLFKRLEILGAFEWNNKEEDSFFHGVGKIKRIDTKSNQENFFDLSCDACLMEVVETMNYEEILKNKPLGYTVLITDPDGDRLVLGQVEPIKNYNQTINLGINCIKIDKEKFFAVYHPVYSFLMTMDYYMKILQDGGLWHNHPRFMITTTPSSRAWDEWAKANDIKVISTPVGFKEIATVVKKIEKQLIENPDDDIVVQDIYGNKINVGINPRLVFGGEESGGMIISPEEILTSKGGRKAIAMREKSAGEASVITTIMAAYLYKQKKFFSEYLNEIFASNSIRNKFYIRDDIVYYNESEPDPKKLLAEKADGEKIRDKTDLYYLGLSLALREKKIDIIRVRKILSEAMPELNFNLLQNILFVGDANYFQFDDFFVEIRKSGTDAKMRGYANGSDIEVIKRYLHTLLYFTGDVGSKYEEYLPGWVFDGLYIKSREIYLDFLHKGL